MANILLPFLKCSSPEEAKEVLDSMKDNALGPRVHRILFQKGLVNNFSDKVKKVMLPEDKAALKRLTRNVKTYNRLNEKIDLRLLKSGKALLDNTVTDDRSKSPSMRGRAKKQNKDLVRGQSMRIASKDDSAVVCKNRVPKEARERWENLNTRIGLESLLEHPAHR